MRAVRIHVATENEVKLRAVETVSCEFLDDREVKVVRVAVPGDLPARPYNHEVIEGAIARAHAALAQGAPDFGIGIEAGLTRLPGSDRWFNLQVCAIVDRAGRLSLGFGAGFEVPDRVSEAVLDGDELQEVLRSQPGVSEPELHLGLIHHLSRGRIDRSTITIDAVRMALLPWLPND
ncbi:MAG: DUF84 family protein [Candidatus Bipolaricaulia bacterium]